jgi:NADH-quinone oxidoreductase subunit A
MCAAMFAQGSDVVANACNNAANCPAQYSDLLRQYLTVAILGGVAVGLVAGMLAVGSLLRPSRRTGHFQGQKHVVYESGVDPVGTGWGQSQVRYYIFALLFVIFDVEAAFLFPWAASIERYGTFGLVAMLIFIVLLLDGLVYAWKRGLLRWV